MMGANVAGSGLGSSVPRPEARRFVEGRGRYLDDLTLPGMLHVAFLRSPLARARFRIVDTQAARASAGVEAVITGADLRAVCKPWQTRLAGLPAHRSPPQYPLAVDEAYWQGEAVVAVAARTRAQAEDALELVEIEWDEVPPVVDAEAALSDGAPVCHPALESNLALDRTVAFGDAEGVLAAGHTIVTRSFVFGRQTGVTLEPRGLLAHYDPRVSELTVYQSHQAPFQTQEVLAAQLGLDLERVRVVTPDVGGAFGLKLHAYPDEMAVAGIAVLLGRPVKFQADRLESFVSDIHARDAQADARLAVDPDGRILALSVNLLFAFGSYSIYPRSSVGEALQALDLCGAAYQVPAFAGRVRGVFVNKVPTGAYRAVGQPIACAVIEQLLDDAAAQLRMDPLEIRRRNHLRTPEPDQPPLQSGTGIVLGALSLDACLSKLADGMQYERLRQEQRRLRVQGVWRGIGLCNFVELTSVGNGLYGVNAVRIAGKEGVRLSLTTGGRILCRSSATDQGQGTRTGLAQVIAHTVGVPLAEVTVTSGDTALDPLGGGAWASRGLSLAGEAALRAGCTLRTHILAIAAAALKRPVHTIRLCEGAIRGPEGELLLTLVEVALLGHYNTLALQMNEVPPLTVEESFAPVGRPYFAANGVQAAHVEIDPCTGMIRVLDFWVVEDCGRVINPLLADEQIRGGVVQGIGAALYEHCVYSETAQMSNASLADYLLPMAGEMPDIHVEHVSTPERATELGAKGIGEAGTVGAIGAIWCAVNDALRHTGHQLTQQPFTPAQVLETLNPDD